MPDINSINDYLTEILSPTDFNDIALNGIQIENSGEIKKITFSVDASIQAINESISLKSNLLISHHGFYWGKQSAITGISYNRIKNLVVNNIGLIAYHLPLDANGEIGNNIEILNKIPVEKKYTKPFGSYHGNTIGWQTELINEVSIEDLISFLELKNYPHKYLNFGAKKIKKIGVVSGGGDFAFDEALTNKLDLFITGDSSHILFHAAKENNINVLFAGHYFTETFGILALKKLVEKKFKIETEFLNIPTDL